MDADKCENPYDGDKHRRDSHEEPDSLLYSWTAQTAFVFGKAGLRIVFVWIENIDLVASAFIGVHRRLSAADIGF